MEHTPFADAVQSWEYLSRRIPVLLIASIIAGIVAYGVASRLPVSYDVSLSYVVSQESRDPVSDFRYDGYYAISATDLFTTTLASWIVSPETVVRFYEKAHIPLPTEDPISLSKRIIAIKAAPQLVNITVKHPSKLEAEKLAAGIAQVVPAFVEQYNTTGSPASRFAVVASSPWTGVSRIAPLPISLIVFVFVFIVGVLWTLFTQALKRGSS